MAAYLPVRRTVVQGTLVGPRRKLGLDVLDALRGLAALYVVLHHANQLLWTGDGPLVLDRAQGIGFLAERVAVQAFRFGPQAVLLFFLISGFCIHLRQARRLTDGSHTRLATLFDVRDYSWRRIRRLYPVF